MVLQKTDLAKSNDYFRQIHPAEAAAVDAARAEEQRKAQAKKAASPAPAAS
jgi:NADH-quinone oxidoreductase subunit I